MPGELNGTRGDAWKNLEVLAPEGHIKTGVLGHLKTGVHQNLVLGKFSFYLPRPPPRFKTGVLSKICLSKFLESTFRVVHPPLSKEW